MENKQQTYLNSLPRKWVYGSLVVLTLLAVALFLFVPHYKPLKLATMDEVNQAHHDIIHAYFLKETRCQNDNRSARDRILEFNKYFKVNKYANRAVIRGCNDSDLMLARADSNKWLVTEVNITLNTRQNPVWQQACLIDDITTADTKVRSENASIDDHNLSVCDKLRKESYIQL